MSPDSYSRRGLLAFCAAACASRPLSALLRRVAPLRVPFSRAKDLLERLAGRGEPRYAPAPTPVLTLEPWGSELEGSAAEELLDLLLDALRRIDDLQGVLRRVLAEIYRGGNDPRLTAQLRALCEERLALANGVRFQGHALLDGRTTIHAEVLEHGIPVLPIHLPAIDGTTFQDPFVDLVSCLPLDLGRVLSQLRSLRFELDPDAGHGGLPRIQRLLQGSRNLARVAAQGSLNTVQRMPLNRRFEHGLELIQETADSLGYEGQPLLQGDCALTFESGSPAGTPQVLELPRIDVKEWAVETPEGIPVEFNLLTMTSAQLVLAPLEDVIAEVMQARRDVRGIHEALFPRGPRRWEEPRRP